MKFTIFFALFVTVAFAAPKIEKDTSALETAIKPIRLINRCRPARIQRDALCGCYTCRVFGLADRSFSRRCGMLFRTGMRGMRRACRFYMVRTRRGRRFRSRALLNNLRFISGRCPRMLNRAGFDVSVRPLTNFQVVQAIDDIILIIRDMLEHLDPMPAMTAAPARMLVVGDSHVKKVARLAAYNNMAQ